MTDLRTGDWLIDETNTLHVIDPVGDMQWRKADGSTGEYHGLLHDLGYGIPRNPRTSWGLRRAVFDLAFGYVSGFPMWDIIVFSTRSLFPPRTLDTAQEDD